MTTLREDMHWYEFEALVCELSGLYMMLPNEPEISNALKQVNTISTETRSTGKFSKENQKLAWEIQRAIKPEHVKLANELYHQESW